MSRKRQSTQAASLEDAFQQAAFILQSMCCQKRDFEDEAEGEAFLHCVDEISQSASYMSQQAFILVLYLSVEHMKAQPDSNSLAADNLHLFELRFRASCSPLFDQLKSFLPVECRQSTSTDVDNRSEPRNRQ